MADLLRNSCSGTLFISDLARRNALTSLQIQADAKGWLPEFQLLPSLTVVAMQHAATSPAGEERTAATCSAYTNVGDAESMEAAKPKRQCAGNGTCRRPALIAAMACLVLFISAASLGVGFVIGRRTSVSDTTDLLSSDRPLSLLATAKSAEPREEHTTLSFTAGSSREPLHDLTIQSESLQEFAAPDSWAHRCPIQATPSGIDPMIKVAALLHHGEVIKARRGYGRVPHVLLIDDSTNTVSGLAGKDPMDLKENEMLTITQFPDRWGWGQKGDVMLWNKDKESDIEHRDGVLAIERRVKNLLDQGKNVHVVLDWDKTLHSAGGWTTGKIDRWRSQSSKYDDDLDILNERLVEFISQTVSDHVTFGIATHNSFHKGKGRGEEEVYAEDLTEHFFRLVASVFGSGKFEVVTSGNPLRYAGTSNLWSPEMGIENGDARFCTVAGDSLSRQGNGDSDNAAAAGLDAAADTAADDEDADTLPPWRVNAWWKNKAEELWLLAYPDRNVSELHNEFQAAKKNSKYP